MGKRLLEDSAELVAQIKKEFFDDCLTIKEVASIHNCSTPVIQRFLKRHNIRRNFKFSPSSDEQLLIREKLKVGYTRKEIAELLNVKPYLVNAYVNREILNKGQYNNELTSEKWIEDKNCLYWYFLGLFASDGHLGKFNEISIFQKDGHYLKELQHLIGHTGKLYGENKTCYILKINSHLLHSNLEELEFEGDKRYNAPFIKCPSTDFQFLYLRGLFDGDGSIYYNYISGAFENIKWEICTGSEKVATCLNSFLSDINIHSYIFKNISSAGNNYYHVEVKNKKDIIKIFELLYKDYPSLCLKTKYKKFLKLIKLIELNTQVDEIVDSSMKIEG